MKEITKVEFYVAFLAILFIIVPMLLSLNITLDDDFLNRGYERIYKFKGASKANW